MEPLQPQEMKLMDVKTAILARRSVRKFSDQPISDDVIDALLSAAMAAPSACNKQPWEFYVIKDPAMQERLRKVSRYSDMNGSLMIIVAGNDKRSLAHRPNDFWIQDCAAATENMLLMATALGVSSCWCGLFPMVSPVKRVRSCLSLGDEIIPMALVQLGYSDETPEPRTQYNPKRVHIIEQTGDMNEHA